MGKRFRVWSRMGNNIQENFVFGMEAKKQIENK